MSGYTTSPILSAVLRDLEDTERHRRCEAETWLYVADDRFECSVCGVVRTSVRYNQITGVSGESDTVSGGPGSLLTPRGRGRSRTRGVSP